VISKKCLKQLKIILNNKLNNLKERELIRKLAPKSNYVPFSAFVKSQRALGLSFDPTLKEWKNSCLNFCELTEKEVSHQGQLKTRCFYSSWSYLIFKEVYGFSDDDHQLHFLNLSSGLTKEDVPKELDFDVGWTLGAALVQISKNLEKQKNLNPFYFLHSDQLLFLILLLICSFTLFWIWKSKWKIVKWNILERNSEIE